MALVLLAGLQLLALAGVGVLIWRRLDALSAEIARLREALDAAQVNTVGARRVRRAESVRLAPVDDEPPLLFPEAHVETRDDAAQRAARVWGRADADALSPRMRETVHGVVLALSATVPALGFFFSLDPVNLVAAGICIGGAMMLFALHPQWRAAGWAGTMTASAWALLGFVLGATEAQPLYFSAALMLAGAAGLAHAYARHTNASMVLALAMSAAALALASEIGLVSTAGAAFAALVVMAAIVGAVSLRLEGVHLAAFGAALLGLFVLSGQESAAIWFTPAAAWVGALFLGIAAIRVPHLGARGVALAGSGVLAPLAAVGALHLSRHGLADPGAAAAAFAMVAAAIAGIIALAATRRERGVAALKLTLWTLGSAAFAAITAAILLTLPAPFAAPAFAALTLGLIALDWRLPDAVWRTLAWIAAGLAALSSIVGVQMLMAEAANWEPWLLVGAALAAPALLMGGGAYVAERNPAPLTAGVFEALAIGLGVTAANFALRLLASDGALLLTSISFAEAGLHITIWLIASLLIATRAKLGSTFTRNSAAMALGAAALLSSAAMTLMWLTPHWTARTPGLEASPLLQFDGLGFLAPAIFFFGHWVLWRARGANLRTRLALGAGTLLIASLTTLVVLQVRDSGQVGTDWLGAMIGAFAFALALGINFAPGVVRLAEARPSYFEENLQRNRRRQVRRQAR